MIENRAVGHQEPRGLRGAGRDDADRGPLGARGRRADEGRGAGSSARSSSAGRRSSTRASGSARRARRSTRSSTRRRSSSPARFALELRPNAAVVTGRRSPHTLYAETLASYGTGETFPHDAAEGFIRISSLETELARRESARRQQGIIPRVTPWAGRVESALARRCGDFLRADDAELLPYDCEATAEHARRLAAAGLLTDEELDEVEARLAEIAQDPDALPRVGRGRPLGDRAAARRRRAQDPRRPVAQRPGRGGVPPVRARRLRARRARRSTRSRS